MKCVWMRDGAARDGRPYRLYLFYVVDVDRLVLKVLVEPVQDVLKPLDSMPRSAGPGQLMCLAREPHHGRWNMAIFQGAKHLLAAIGRWSPHIRLALDKHHRGRHILDVSDRRPVGEVLGFFPR